MHIVSYCKHSLSNLSYQFPTHKLYIKITGNDFTPRLLDQVARRNGLRHGSKQEEAEANGNKRQAKFEFGTE